jgi:hypothetical protein
MVLALTAIPALLIAFAIGIVSIDSSDAPRAAAHESPVGCNANNLVLGFARVPASGQNGDTIEYRILARNNTGDDPFACDITGANVSFTEPAADGTATGTTHILATNVNLPADGSGDLCFISSTAPASLACPAGTTVIIDDDLSYVLNVNPGVTAAIAAARITGNRPPTTDCPNGAATLHDSDTESDACAAQTLTTTVPNAKISLSPPTATNEVGTTHQITCTIQVHVGGPTTFTNAPDGTLCDADIDSGPGSFVGDDDDCTVDGGDGNCIITITSNVTGRTVVSACTEESAPPGGLTVNSVVLSRCTDGQQVAPGHSNGLPVEKFWVDARILLSPSQDSNAVGSNHNFTCTIQIDIGDGNGFVNAPAGTTCDLDIVSGPGDFDPAGDDSCTTIGATGACQVDIVSNVTGITVVSACTEETSPPAGLTVTASNAIGAVVSRCTTALQSQPTVEDCTPITAQGAVVGSTSDAVKCWVDARIQISPNGTNAVNDTHTFTCTIEVDTGSGFGPAPDATQCEVSIVGGPGSITGSPCSTLGGSCDVSADSAVTGLTEVQACADLTVLSVTFNDLCTEAIDPAPTGEDCEPTPTTNPPGVNALKCWVNARITLTPDGTNEVDDDHTFTCTIEIDTGSGFAAAPDGTQCEVSIVSGPGTITGSPCSTVSGSCTVTDSSPDAGIDEVQACADVTVEGVTFNDLCTTARTTTPTTDDCETTPTPTPLGENAVKCWVDARISITPDGHNPVNSPHTFTCTIEIDTGSGFVDAPDGTDCEVAITNGGPGTITGSPCQTVSGSCTVTDNSATPGIDEVQACTDVEVLGLTLSRCTSDLSPNPTQTDCPAEGASVPTTSGENAIKCWFEERGGEGCTPGYWKQPQHFGNWTAPYDPNDLFSEHFENAFPGMTLLQVLSQGGGGLKALGRHTVAALLNSASAGVDYEFTTAEVIAEFNAVFPGGDYEALKNQFATENERGCGLGRAEL